MKPPAKPPDYWATWEKVQSSKRVGIVFDHHVVKSYPHQYLHWDKLRHLSPPNDLTHEEWWLALKLHRHNLQKELPLHDVDGNSFSYSLADPIPERLHYIDQQAAGSIAMPDAITNPETKNRYLVRSLIEEAIASSQLEGAATTREVAKEMIRTGRRPIDQSERMILNNFRTMEGIGKLRDERLTPSLVFEIHRLITAQTLDNPSAAGRLRSDREDVCVDDMYGHVLHVPPPADQLEERMLEMCNFANEKSPVEFLHPVLRSMILHFWLAYDHPFVDGNGRTARALFYWSMLHRGYWLCEYVSISELIRKGPAKYGRAFLYTETDENDLTHFLVYHLQILQRALRHLHHFVARKTKQLHALENELQGIIVLNYRQRALISHALRHPRHRYTIESHRRSHGVVYQTARMDLLDLVDRKLLTKAKLGREWHFTPTPNLEDKLRNIT